MGGQGSQRVETGYSVIRVGGGDGRSGTGRTGGPHDSTGTRPAGRGDEGRRRDRGCLRLLHDQLEIYAEHCAGWSLAEPLVEELARCFEGLIPAGAADLARSFAFDGCVRRREPEDLVTADTRPPG